MQRNQTLFSDNENPAIAIPPPTSSRQRLHKRSRTTIDLPPLHTRTASASPTRLSTFLPSLRSASRTTSPERNTGKDTSEGDDESDDLAQKSRPGAGVRALASWFEGSSDPLNISLVPSPNKEEVNPIQSTDNMDRILPPTNDPVDNLTARPQSRPPTSASSTRFSFFRKASQIQSPTRADDSELSTLDIRDTLFPSGPPDEFSPAAFKNLQLNAEGTLRRFQAAHIEQHKTIKSLTTTRTAQADDLEASQTRNEHLKLQLVEMAERSAEQERLISALRTELDHASSPYRVSSETRDISIRKVSSSSNPPQSSGPYRRNRSSNISNLSSDSDSSSVVSVFSTVDSMNSPGTSIAASPIMKHANLHYTSVQNQPSNHPAAVMTVQECQQCHGVKASEAWDVVTVMKAESQALKQRISELEVTNEEVLGLIWGSDPQLS